MRKAVLPVIILCLLFAETYAQGVKDTAKDSKPVAVDTLLPYQKNSALPTFNILLTDSVTIFNTYNIPQGKPVALMFFFPDCKHCKYTVKELLKSMDSIKNIQFYMFTPVHDMNALREFYKDYHLADYKNIKIVGRDYEFFFFSFFGTKTVPDIALYDEHKKLVKLIQGETNATELYKLLH